MRRPSGAPTRPDRTARHCCRSGASSPSPTAPPEETDTFMLTGLHHVQVASPAGSEDALRAFYGGVLGMSEVEKPPVLAARGGVWFRSAGAEIHCGVEADFRPARKA